MRKLSFLYVVAFSTLSCTASAHGALEGCELGNSGNIADSYRWNEAKRLVETLLPFAEATGVIDGELGMFQKLLEDAKTIFGNELILNRTTGPTFIKKSGSEEDIGFSPEEDDDIDMPHADRFFREIRYILDDEECMSGTLDVESPAFNMEDVIRLFDKCRLVHLRNFYPKKMLMDYKRNITSYVQGIASGRISEEGKTSYSGEMYYFSERTPYRYDLCFTEDLVNEELLLNDLLMDILRHPFVLDEKMNMLDFGVILAEPGAPVGHWHRDSGDYIFPISFSTSDVAGHDLPPFAVAVITPLLNVTMKHGPTEFCMGSSNLAGLDSLFLEDIPVKDPALRELRDLFVECTDICCPAEAWRTPLLSFGDVLLFDYSLFHRGGHNDSPDLRALIYNTYSRPWVRH
uniref:Phytanoyl-CoA dioxygenase n=1 Tax=Ditylum brightwellii TaxID=49249 RepID=A0A6V2DTI8_9STRA|mmetsp:Transcript_28625/g.42877  ORF Transcript_28625/g.42877 Transcript_28625/m.42877 type:complete len:403 (-) Transcript_28625:996-2204(-)